LTPSTGFFSHSGIPNPAVFIPFHCIKTGPKTTEVNMASYHFSVKSKNKGYASHYLYIARLMQYEGIRKKVMKF
jgi:hypothetical protein